MPRDRTRARDLAREYTEKNDPTGWFEQLYQEAEAGKSDLPWADLKPNINLMDFAAAHPLHGAGKRALVVGCGLGDDAEQIAAWGFATTAFDISTTAIRSARKRFPDSRADYVAADLLKPPQEWRAAFDFIFESYTLQALPADLRAIAYKSIASFLRKGGELLVLARGREESDPAPEAPWPLTVADLAHFQQLGLKEISFEDFADPESPETRRFRVLYRLP